ncbi:hypothetical protein BDZ90DRAFT_101090 [Jaminaea rosea]|uniref:Secreted protein n=1 Tax=Jaminaea rosea TaxID=1569628 RepID=A0A316UKZ8_9BASI|nr:hypothetical protein BDZ90DRAFT_101090 [Jaminaea rosea]PWN24603.1 hypothetical protein BDZ90DRAFT_101090 [Jaminaea rosea]
MIERPMVLLLLIRGRRGSLMAISVLLSVVLGGAHTCLSQCSTCVAYSPCVYAAVKRRWCGGEAGFAGMDGVVIVPVGSGRNLVEEPDEEAARL